MAGPATNPFLCLLVEAATLTHRASHLLPAGSRAPTTSRATRLGSSRQGSGWQWGHTHDVDGPGAVGWGGPVGPHMAGEVPFSQGLIGEERDGADGATIFLGCPIDKGLQGAAVPIGDPDSMAGAGGQVAHHTDHQLPELPSHHHAQWWGQGGQWPGRPASWGGGTGVRGTVSLGCCTHHSCHLSLCTQAGWHPALPPLGAVPVPPRVTHGAGAGAQQQPAVAREPPCQP